MYVLRGHCHPEVPTQHVRTLRLRVTRFLAKGVQLTNGCAGLGLHLAELESESKVHNNHEPTQNGRGWAGLGVWGGPPVLKRGGGQHFFLMLKDGH